MTNPDTIRALPMVMAFELIAFSVYNFSEAFLRKINMQISGVSGGLAQGRSDGLFSAAQTRPNYGDLAGTELNSP
ncbi:hypothetical protein SAMN05444507_104166 [Pseudomonas syringae]|nr:hypothetical protein SAMN05444507_104166 [Pseudomonas syringae]